MGKEEFLIRINRKGEIFVETADLTPQKIRDLADFLAETIGTTKVTIVDDSGENPGKVEFEDLLATLPDDDPELTERDKKRQRIRDSQLD